MGEVYPEAFAELLALVPALERDGNLALAYNSLLLSTDADLADRAARAWCAELRVSGQRANAAGIGPGCGVLFAAADLAAAGSMRRAADAYVRTFNEQSAAADAGVHLTASFVISASATG